MRMRKSLLVDIIIILIITLVSSLIIFNNLGTSTVKDWDEARYGESALEILKTNNWIVMKYAGEPSLAKPPLGIWLIAISFSLFGINEFALRFFSALAGVLTIIIVYLFGKEISNRYVGIFSATILITIQGFIGFHSARSGDLDSLVTFFITLSLFLFYKYTKTKNTKLLIGTGIAIGLGFLTKSIVGLFPILIIGICIIHQNSLKEYLNKKTLYSALAFLLIVLPWYTLCFFKESNYYKRLYTFLNEIIRGPTPPKWSIDPFYYLQVLASNFDFLLLAILITSFVFLLYLAIKKKKYASFLIIWILTIIIIFSLAKNKTFWYIIPLYPPLCIITALGFEKAKKIFKLNRMTILIIFILILLLPFIKIINYTNQNQINPVHNSIKSLNKDLEKINSTIYFKHLDIYDNNKQSTFFYLNAYSKARISSYTNFSEINTKKGEYVISFDNKTTNILNNKTDYELELTKKDLYLFKKLS